MFSNIDVLTIQSFTIMFTKSLKNDVALIVHENVQTFAVRTRLRLPKLI